MTDETPEPEHCVTCGEPLPDSQYAKAGGEDGVMIVYDVKCCGGYGVTLPVGDVQTAAQRFKERQQRRRGRGGQHR
ncbi:hypothetical protein BRD56_10455 [Thermoplasmatales archaeon SW_10_69_26]|nr:MAG: hypothetical protein BRD56_10455 [Thermoplasmatales archaeon SW_10_69_26]